MHVAMIPAVLYVAVDGHDREQVLRAAERLRGELDDHPERIHSLRYAGAHIPGVAVNMDDPIRILASYDTPDGRREYDVELCVDYPGDVEPDPDTPPGYYSFRVRGRNSFEAGEMALDHFHTENPLRDPGAATVEIERVSRPPRQTFPAR